MGYVEETGAAQYLRDARIATIYEGTTGIQAADLVGRKILRDRGVTIRLVIDTIRALDRPLGARQRSHSRRCAARSRPPSANSMTAVAWVLETGARRHASARSPRPCRSSNSLGTVLGGYELARAALPRPEACSPAGPATGHF